MEFFLTPSLSIVSIYPDLSQSVSSTFSFESSELSFLLTLVLHCSLTALPISAIHTQSSNGTNGGKRWDGYHVWLFFQLLSRCLRPLLQLPPRAPAWFGKGSTPQLKSGWFAQNLEMGAPPTLSPASMGFARLRASTWETDLWVVHKC